MNLVEACKLAKNIEALKYQIADVISSPDYAAKITERHLKSKADENLADETIEREVTKMYDITTEQAIQLLDILMQKKAELSSAIEAAKHDIRIDVNGMKLAYDSAIEYNKSLRDLAIYRMNRLNRLKEGVVKTTASAYRFNVEGNQTPYKYDVEIETTLLIDAKDTKNKEKNYRKLADEISTKLDEAKLNTKIDLDLGIEVNDTLEDVIDAFLN